MTAFNFRIGNSIKRRAMLFLCAAAIVAPRQAQSSTRIGVLTDLVNALGAAGDAITKITEGIRSLVLAGRDSFTYIAAVQEKNALTELVRDLTHVMQSQHFLVILTLSDYLDKPDRDQKDWAQVCSNLSIALGKVLAILERVRNVNGDFVLERAYKQLGDAISQRASLGVRRT